LGRGLVIQSIEHLLARGEPQAACAVDVAMIQLYHSYSNTVSLRTRLRE